jgi:hypothetical protein
LRHPSTLGSAQRNFAPPIKQYPPVSHSNPASPNKKARIGNQKFRSVNQSNFAPPLPPGQASNLAPPINQPLPSKTHRFLLLRSKNPFPIKFGKSAVKEPA